MSETEVPRRRGRPPKPKEHKAAADDCYSCPKTGETYRQRHRGICEGCGESIPTGLGMDQLK